MPDPLPAPIAAILRRMTAADLYEVEPLTGIFPAADLPRGYSGEAYHRDDPRLVEALSRRLQAGWSLPDGD